MALYDFLFHFYPSVACGKLQSSNPGANAIHWLLNLFPCSDSFNTASCGMVMFMLEMSANSRILSLNYKTSHSDWLRCKSAVLLELSLGENRQKRLARHYCWLDPGWARTVGAALPLSPTLAPLCAATADASLSCVACASTSCCTHHRIIPYRIPCSHTLSPHWIASPLLSLSMDT